MNIIQSISPYTIVENNGLYGIQDDKGNWVVPCEMLLVLNRVSQELEVSIWDEIGIVELIKDHRIGFFAKNGTFIEPQFDDIAYEDGLMQVKKGDQYGIISFNDFDYQSIRPIDSDLWRNDFDVKLREMVIYKLGNKWYKNIYAENKVEVEQYIGERIGEKIVDEITFDKAERHYFDDSGYEGTYIFEKENKYAIFIVDEEFGLKDGIFKSEEIIPFKYDFVEIRHPEGENFVFAIVQENNIWSVLKIHRLPIPSIESLESFETFEEAIMKYGIADELDFID